MSWLWIDAERAGPRYLNRGALRHFLRLVERDRQGVGMPVIVLPARNEDWVYEVIRGGVTEFRNTRPPRENDPLTLGRRSRRGRG